jgi:hypothetical protein
MITLKMIQLRKKPFMQNKNTKDKLIHAEQPSLKNFSASLVFGFCPMEALIASTELTSNSEEIKLLAKECPRNKIKNILGAFRYFYICYCLKIEELEQDNKNYFYLQTFSQIGDQQTPAAPIYGFYNNEEIMSMIKDVDNLFSPDTHEKQIFESYLQELDGDASQLIELMQNWTSLKLLQFNDLYFQDEDAIHNLYQLINDEDDFEKNAKTQKRKKSAPDSKKPTTPKATTKKTARKTIKNKKNI